MSFAVAARKERHSENQIREIHRVFLTKTCIMSVPLVPFGP